MNRRDLDGFLALHDGRYEDRRRGLRNEGPVEEKFARAVLYEACASWRIEIEPVAIRGGHFGLTRERWRDTDGADRPIAVEWLMFTEINDDELISYAVAFDPDDINGAIDELTARWIASGDVTHPEIIESVLRFNEEANRHDWDAIATRLAGATYISHRQLGIDGADIEDYVSSIRMFESLVPDLWTELAEVLAHSAIGLVAYMVLKGTSTDDVAIEIPTIHLALIDGDRVTHLETFDPAQCDLALTRFQELNTFS